MDTTVILIAIAIVIAGAAVALVLGARRGATEDATRMRELAASQAELAGRLQQLGETQAAAQAQLTQTLEQRLDAVTKRLGDGFAQQTEKTGQTLKGLHERLATIDAAQKNITELSGQVVGLQDILSNKQARGAFGEIQLQDLVRDILPPSAYAFQCKLGNGRIADCVLKLPNPPGLIVIDSKYPLEAYRAFRDATGEAAEKAACRAFGTDVMKHVRDIAERYIIPGETAESALMFVPSEAVYAEIYASLADVVEKSYRARVFIVSPTTLMATLNTVRAILKDARMREQAGVIQVEVTTMLMDVARLDERVGNLQKHFDLAARDIGEIRTSADKVRKRGTRITEIEVGEVEAPETLAPSPPQLREI